MPSVTPGYTVSDVAKLLRVGPDKVRGWLRRGELKGLNTSSAKCRRPRFIVLPDQFAAFVNGHSAADPKPAPRRRKLTTAADYFPD